MARSTLRFPRVAPVRDGIFISYRRADAGWTARALFERLRHSFQSRVFIDVSGTSLGSDYAERIDESLHRCHIMLAVMGPRWLAMLKERHQDKRPERDWVEFELRRGLESGVRVVPLLVDGAVLPPAKELPPSLKALPMRQLCKLGVDDFESDVEHLIKEVSKLLQPSQDSEPRAPLADAPPSAPQRERAARRPNWISGEGRDARGHWTDVSVGAVTQRIRWIPPGSFLMGSPADSGSPRETQDEYQHLVELTRGFWLSDTTCTQELWREILNESPSRFSGTADLPVEQVSWLKIRDRFLPELNRRLPGLTASMPTEAQWEYACRAGTTTAYATGDRISTLHANFNGMHRSAMEPGVFRNRTVSVKSFPPSAWGLYQMHGNVWEWCADIYEPFSGAPCTDPVGPPTGDKRTLKGGSWFTNGRALRSANRYALEPSDSGSSFGFRFAATGIPAPSR